MDEKEKKILDFWKENKIFSKSLEKKSPKGEFVFYDGPPTANGKPGIHHLEPSAFKDVIPRYKTMRGFHVSRKRGWDTHGLPVEIQVEKELGLKSKKEIEQYGIEKFNKKCRESVWKYVQDWRTFTTRIGFWIDYENPYITYENSYMESVWNILKTVDDKKLIYKDYKVLPWCPRCGTALSSHELAQGYQDDKDLAVTAKFKLLPDQKFGNEQEFVTGQNAYILAWTTTPWTLPGNVALAVGEKISYSAVRIDDIKELLIVASDLLEKIFKDHKIEIVHTFKGKGLIGLKYEPLYHFLANKFNEKDPIAFEKSYQVYGADFVNTEDGTGIVHTAVMYGQDDFVLGTKVGLPKYHLVKDDGHFADNMDFLSDRFVKDEEVAIDIIKDLAHRGLLFKKEKYEHSYPHCWRCKTPLIYYARDSWYIKMSSLRDELVKQNEDINWEPEYIKEGRFGEWLREIKDWAISRERYWGTPLPFFLNKKGEVKVFGSVSELKKNTKKSGNKYFLMRHGEAENNVLQVLDSNIKMSYGLTDEGKKQIKEAAKKVKKINFDYVFVSPIFRTMQTFDVLNSELSLKVSPTVDERLWEFRAGEFDGKPRGDFMLIFKNKEEEFTVSPKDGESLNDVKKRVGDFLYECEAKYQNKNILIISHGDPIWMMHSVAKGMTIGESLEYYKDKYPKNGVIDELDFNTLPHNENYELDLHRPFIDSIEYEDENGEKLTRVKEVLDVWFDSGAMPFAQNHYPFEDKLVYPADYISEAIDQTRGWFYTLHAIGVLMGKGKAYKNVVCLGHILDSQGKKMSKSLGNIVEPFAMIEKYGVDALRFWMYSVNQPGESKNFDEKTVDEIVKKVFNPLENILSFYELYKDDSVEPNDESKNILDKWILSKLNELISNGTKSLDKFKIFEASRAIRDFANDFSTWYLRRSRDRFKSDDTKERNEALATTRFVFLELIKYMAPMTPFFSEGAYQRLKVEKSPESVHLEDWPKEGKIDEKLLEEMQKAREVVTRALELRQKSGHKVRQPLSSLTVSLKFSDELLDIIADEVNVKKVTIGEGEMKLDTTLTPELIEEGKVRDAIRAIQEWRKENNLTPGKKVAYEIPEGDMDLFQKHAEEIKRITNVEF